MPSKLTAYWAPVVIYCVMIFIQSSFQSAGFIPDLPSMDKVLHLSGYALLGALFFRAFRKSLPGFKPLSIILISVCAASLYGLSDEIHQYFVPSRTCDILDFAADSIGGTIGVLGYMYFLKKYLSGYPFHSRIDKIAGFL